jgi:hypothetical protein
MEGEFGRYSLGDEEKVVTDMSANPEAATMHDIMAGQWS